MDALAELCAGGHLPARIVRVISDRPHVPAIERARRRGLATAIVPTRGVAPDAWVADLNREIERSGAELIVLAGYRSILPPAFVDRWAGRAINLHPSLLPRHGGPGMYGLRVHEAVLQAGDRETGATVHLVTNDVDRGPILAQSRVPVGADATPESLRALLHPVEVELLAGVVRRFADGALPLPYRVSRPPSPSDAGVGG